MFLTESQKKYLKTIKNMSKAKPHKTIIRPEVNNFLLTLLINPNKNFF